MSLKDSVEIFHGFLLLLSQYPPPSSGSTWKRTGLYLNLYRAWKELLTIAGISLRSRNVSSI